MKVRIKRVSAVLLSVILMLTTMFSMNITVATAATSGTCGNNATWNFNASTGTLTISGSGAVNDYNALLKKVPWESYKPQIRNIVVNENITVIGNYCFYNCVNLTSVTLPSTLTALNGSGTMEASYGCFQGCTALQTITLPNGLVSIGNCVFKDCTALKSIRFPDSVTTISYGAFCGCSALESVTFGSGLTSTGSNAFYNAGVKRITWGANISDISMYSFYGCNMTTIDIPESVTSIGLRALANCSFLTNVIVNNRNMSFTGDPCDGSEQSITIHGYIGSTAQSYATEKNYAFSPLDVCPHTSQHDYIAVEPTCLEEGLLQHVCDACGVAVTEEAIEPLGHDYEEVERYDATNIDGHIYTTNYCERCDTYEHKVEHQRTPEGSNSRTRYIWIDGYYDYTNTATCTRPGIARYTCTIEGCTMLGGLATSETVDAALANHTVENYQTVTPATCTEKGSAKGTCSKCGAEQTKELPALGHNYTEDNLLELIDNTDDDGHIHHLYECQRCHEQVIESDHVEWVEGFYEANVVSPARCVIDGLEIDTCQLCNNTRSVVLKANGQHEWYETNRTSPTCSSVGKIYYACRNCSMTKSEDIPALEHDFVKIEANSSNPTCTVNGVTYLRCSRCPATRQETVPALGHTIDEDNYNVISEPTCEEEGSIVSVCTVCGEQFTKTVPANGHDYVDKITDLTIENKPGHSLVTPTCSVCKTTKTSYMRHDEWLEGYYTNAPGMTSTCNVEGFTTDTCTICNTTRRNPLPTLGHIYNVTGTVNEKGVQYRCSICLRTAYFDADTILSHWNKSVFNSKVINRSGPDNSDYSSMLDANGDGIINGKDYAILYNSSKKQAAAEEEAANAEPVNVKITVNEVEFDAVFNTEMAAREFVKMLPLTVNMLDRNSNSKYTLLTSSLSSDPQEYTEVNKGDIMLSGSNSLMLFYDDVEAEANYTKLGYIVNTEGLAEALGSGMVSVTFEIVDNE